MKILIIGGTIFLGKHIVNSALKNGHSVTLFNRGKHNPDLFPDIEKLKGDRDGDFESLNGREFDAVIDTCGYVPRIVRKSAEFLKDNVKHYTFISSISVYSDFSKTGVNENSEHGKIEDETTETVDGMTYGPLKYLCEKAVEEIYVDKSLIIRPGLIVGEDDPSDRFTYWVKRIGEGGKVLSPGPEDGSIQFIDVKDLSDFIIKAIENNVSGTYNATGPDYKLTFGEFFNECRKVTESDAEFIWVDEKFLGEEKVIPFTELPNWVPSDSKGVNECDISRAISKGLKFRPLHKTISDTLEFSGKRINYTMKAGLKPEKEKELLKKALKIKENRN